MNEILCHQLKITHFSYNIFNMDISPIIGFITLCLKTSIHIAEIYLEGSASQNSDIGLSFCFILCRKR